MQQEVETQFSPASPRSPKSPKYDKTYFIIDKKPVRKSFKQYGLESEVKYLGALNEFKGKFRVNEKRLFKKHFTTLYNLHKAIVRYNTIFASNMMLNEISFSVKCQETGEQSIIRYTRADIVTYNEIFQRIMSNMYFFFAYRGIKSIKMTPQSFRGSFKMAKITGPLLTFINKYQWSSSSMGDQKSRPLKSGSMASQGYGSFTFFTILLSVIMTVNNKKGVIQDPGERKKAVYVLTNDDVKMLLEARAPYDYKLKPLGGGKWTVDKINNTNNVTMEQAIKKSSFNKESNYSSSGPLEKDLRFNRDAFMQYWIKSFISLSAIPYSELEEDPVINATVVKGMETGEEDKTIITQLLKEYDTLKAYSRSLGLKARNKDNFENLNIEEGSYKGESESEEEEEQGSEEEE